MQKSKQLQRLTKENLQWLKEQGFLYVLIKGYAPERKIDHIGLDHFILTPVKELPVEDGAKGIYADIDSEILADWARSSGAGIEAFIDGYSSLQNPAGDVS